jgi:ATP-binding cassette subfamily B protein IrtA
MGWLMADHRRWDRTRRVLALRRFAGPARAPLLLSVGLALVATVLEVALYYVVFRAVDELVAGVATASSLQRLALVAAACVMARHVMFSIATGVSHVAAFEVIYGLRRRMADKLARLPLGYFDMRRSGELKKVMVDDVERLELFLAHGIPEMAGAISVWAATSGWLLVVDWRLGLATLVVVPAAFGVLLVALRRSDPLIPAWMASADRMNGSIVEYIVAIGVIKVFNRADDALSETRHAVNEFRRAETAWTHSYLPFASVFYSLAVANVVVLLPVGLWLHLSGSVDTTTLLFFLIVGSGSSVPLMRFHKQAMQLSHMASAGEVVEQILAEPELPMGECDVHLNGHAVSLRRVSFAYEERAVLRDVSFTAAEGQITALVGPSGAGKTTIGRLIARFWDVDGGSVLLGGVDVREISERQLAGEVAFVFQDTFLFDDTIEANIRIGKPDASEEQVRAAARAAGCHEFVAALPDGYRTIVGGRGARLSGGERQRVTIARAMLKDAPVIVLDEATAFADPECEAAIQNAIVALVAGRTLIVIAHRLSTIVGADQIVVVDGGTVVDCGAHEPLLQRCALYRRLWNDHVDALPLAEDRGAAVEVSG